jgi:Holliday junction DNA helicase RuvB
MPHMLFVGAAGTGKTTFATVIANEIGSRVFELEAPLDRVTLAELREVARDRDVIFIDEIHMQVSGDRRGITQACDPESFYRLLEDGVLATATGPLSFPAVTWIGATTDVGLLPQPMTDRFTIRPRLRPYTMADMAEIAVRSVKALGVRTEPGVCDLFAGASRCVPREINRYVETAHRLAGDGPVSLELAREVVEDLNGTTLDGLDETMQGSLRYLLLHGRRETRHGVVYSASEGALATACGHGRDTRAIRAAEPYLIQRGLLTVHAGIGRILTPAGIERARQLIEERSL